MSYRSSNQFGTRCNISRFRMYFARRRSTPRIIGRVGRETFTRSIQHRSIFEILIACSLSSKGFERKRIRSWRKCEDEESKTACFELITLMYFFLFFFFFSQRNRSFDRCLVIPRAPPLVTEASKLFSNRQGRRFQPFSTLFLFFSLSSLPFPLPPATRRTPSVALFGPLESCERVIIEDDASIGAISSHLCRLSNRYAITSRRRFKLVKVAAG